MRNFAKSEKVKEDNKLDHHTFTFFLLISISLTDDIFKKCIAITHNKVPILQFYKCSGIVVVVIGPFGYDLQVRVLTFQNEISI